MRIFGYLKKHPGEGLIFKRHPISDSNLPVVTNTPGKANESTSYVPLTSAEVDSSLNDARKGMSTLGQCSFFLGNLIDWKSITSGRVAESSAEAETMAIVAWARENAWLRHLLHDIWDIELKLPTKLLYTEKDFCITVGEDNAAAIAMSKGKQSSKTKYFARDWYRVVDRIRHKEFELVKVPTVDNRADFFTKPLKLPRFLYLKSKIMGAPADQTHFAEKEGRGQKGEVSLVLGYLTLEISQTQFGSGGCWNLSMSIQDYTLRELFNNALMHASTLTAHAPIIAYHVCLFFSSFQIMSTAATAAAATLATLESMRSIASNAASFLGPIINRLGRVLSETPADGETDQMLAVPRDALQIDVDQLVDVVQKVDKVKTYFEQEKKNVARTAATISAAPAPATPVATAPATPTSTALTTPARVGRPNEPSEAERVKAVLDQQQAKHRAVIEIWKGKVTDEQAKVTKALDEKERALEEKERILEEMKDKIDELNHTIKNLEGALVDSQGDLSSIISVAVNVGKKRKLPEGGVLGKVQLTGGKTLLIDIRYVPVPELPEDHVISETMTTERPLGITAREEAQRLHTAFNLVAALMNDSNGNTAYIVRPDLVKRFSSTKLTAKAGGSQFLRQESNEEGKPAIRLVNYNGRLWAIDLPADRKSLSDLRKHIVGEWKEDLAVELAAIQYLMCLVICSSFFPQVMIAGEVSGRFHHVMCIAMFSRSAKSIDIVERPDSSANWADCCRGPNEFELYFALLFHFYQGEFGEILQNLFTAEEFSLLPGAAADTLHLNIWSLKTIIKAWFRVPAALIGVILSPQQDKLAEAKLYAEHVLDVLTSFKRYEKSALGLLKVKVEDLIPPP